MTAGLVRSHTTTLSFVHKHMLTIVQSFVIVMEHPLGESKSFDFFFFFLVPYPSYTA